ncbi:hypothetical protein [Acetobacter orleanensis]|uniref:Uncharacterized protein n=1 Tax=Acetobacter orleanensis TaxID=104099 RepID=A0A4Y3TSW6_9PROT|nr:hypothetical protein [Acetobacter orleanensis]KXV62545.1 hypothetical protein AD949_10535 [Acetobacter orleanensis]PCD80016.1 hypothetical protein CO710_03940 [Acetobacter orleanensis]GAN68331.1 hypothetical protein Abol_015_170 [Acetobacter orleanensis JCM 7639]GBR29818.1 hypothetical protein AA0473_2117 [Acetobacter orleanensis NRIC 0473]GEB83855.1 hypothetical protein AOR01nite_23320 [Acetobacter orleanensis]
MAIAEKLNARIQLTVSRTMDGAQFRGLIGNRIRQERDALIASGAAAPEYVRRVDGSLSKPEEAVRLHGGTVTYIFSTIAQATAWALAECRSRSPVSSGAFRDSWAVLVDGKAWTKPMAQIPSGSEVWIVNTMPYARKIEVGGQQIRVPPRIVEAVRQSLMRRFKQIKALRAFKPLQGGRDARGEPVPYILRSAGIASGLSWNKKEGWGRKHAAYVSRRKDRQAGEQMLYPTLILTEKW